MDGSSGASCGKHNAIDSPAFADGSARWAFYIQRRYLELKARAPRALVFLSTQVHEPHWAM